jgi:hypothetical protein
MSSKDLKKHQRLLALFLLFLMLFNYPVISIVNRPVLVGGIPLLYLYLFIAWLLMLVLLAWVVRDQPSQKDRYE